MHVNGFKTCEIESHWPDESRFSVRAVVCVHAHLNPRGYFAAFSAKLILSETARKL